MKKFKNIILFSFVFALMVPIAFTHDIMKIDHFYSSHHYFDYAAAHMWKFGSELVDNVGPLGFLHYPFTYTGNFYYYKLSWYLLQAAIFSALLFFAAMSASLKIYRILALIFIPLVVYQFDAPWFGYEILPRISSILLIYYIIGFRKMSLVNVFVILLGGFYFSILSMEKLSNLYILALANATITIVFILKKQWHLAIINLLVYWFGILSVVYVTGHNVADLLVIYSSLAHFISGYQGALTTQMPTPLLLMIVAEAILIIYVISRRFLVVLGCKDLTLTIEEVAFLFLCLLYQTITWKHAVLRSYSSAGIFIYQFPVFLMLFLITPITGMPGSSLIGLIRKPEARLLFVSLSASLVVCVVYSIQFGSPFYVFDEFYKRVIAFTQVDKYGVESLSNRADVFKESSKLPNHILHKIDESTVDDYGNIPELILQNKLNYKPRPAAMSQIVGEKTINRLNGDYYTDSTTAPIFVFAERFDTKYTDTMTFASLVFNYKLWSVENGFYILRRNSSVGTIKLVEKEVFSANINESVDLPSSNNPLWLNIKFDYSLIGSIQKLIYKPDALTLSVQFRDGFVVDRQIVPTQGEIGFLISPYFYYKSTTGIAAHDRLYKDTPISIQLKGGGWQTKALYGNTIRYIFSDVSLH